MRMKQRSERCESWAMESGHPLQAGKDCRWVGGLDLEVRRDQWVPITPALPPTKSLRYLLDCLYPQCTFGEMLKIPEIWTTPHPSPWGRVIGKHCLVSQTMFVPQNTSWALVLPGLCFLTSSLLALDELWDVSSRGGYGTSRGSPEPVRKCSPITKWHQSLCFYFPPNNEKSKTFIDVSVSFFF